MKFSDCILPLLSVGATTTAFHILAPHPSRRSSSPSSSSSLSSFPSSTIVGRTASQRPSKLSFYLGQYEASGMPNGTSTDFLFTNLLDTNMTATSTTPSDVNGVPKTVSSPFSYLQSLEQAKTTAPTTNGLPDNKSLNGFADRKEPETTTASDDLKFPMDLSSSVSTQF